MLHSKKDYNSICRLSINSWLGKEYVKITFDNEKVEAEIAEIRELLRDDDMTDGKIITE